MTNVLGALLIGWFAFNFLGAASRARGDKAAITFSALIYGALATAVAVITTS